MCTASRRKNLRINWCLAALFAIPLYLTGCANQESSTISARTIQVSSELAPEQVLNRHLEGDPRSLDPSLVTDVVGQRVEDDLFEGLVTLDEAGHSVPGVALTWNTSPDGKTWTFHLRDNARWSNGQPVTADEFVYSWRREVDPATGSEYSQALAPIENAMDVAAGKMPLSSLGVESAGLHTLVVHLKAPTAYLLALLTNSVLVPLYEPAIKQWGDAWTQPGHMVSNGPFVLSDRVINGHITVVKNPYYWNANRVRLSKVNYLVVSDYDASTDQYLAGNIDFTERFNVTEKDLLQQTLGDQVVISPIFATAMFGYNLTKPPFADNPKLRLALNISLDRGILVNDVMHSVGVPAYNVMPPLDGYTPAIPEWATFSADARHALARKLYQEAGYSDSHPLEAVMTYMSSGPHVRREMEAMAAMWQMNLGARIQIYNEEWKVMLQARQLRQPTFFWDAWSGDYPDPFTFMQLFQTGFGMNDGDYSNPKFDALVNQASSINESAKRFELFHSAEEILNEDAPVLPVYYYVSTHLIKPYVKGWQSNIMDRHLSQYMFVLAHQEI
jgi:oligopeptide transport system substrate-binding protein